MTPVPADAFRPLLSECSEAAFADFVADLWRARGHEVRRDGERLVLDDGQLRPVLAVDDDPTAVVDSADGDSADDAVVVTATEPPPDAGGAVVGPSDLRRVLLYDVPRERAAALFEAHFDRPLDAGPTNGGAGTRAGATANAEASTTGDDGAETTTDGEADPGADANESVADATATRRTALGYGIARVAALAPRDRGDIRATLGDRRARVALAAAAVLLAAAAWALFVYQPAPETANEPPFAVEDPPAPADGSYRMVARMRLTTPDGATVVERSRTYASDGPPVAVERWSLGGVDQRTTTVRYRRGTTSYTRTEWSSDSEYQAARDGRAAGADAVRIHDALRTVYGVDRDGDAVEAAPGGTIPLGMLTQVAYERNGTADHEGRDAVRYAPRAGWVTLGSRAPSGEETVALRVQSTSGEVLVDAETRAVLSADLEATVVRGGTWYEVLTGEPATLAVRYDVATDVDRPAAPPWVDGLRKNASDPGER